MRKAYAEKKNCIVAVSEGVHYADGTFVSEAKTSGTDGFGHAQLGGLAARLADVVKNATGVTNSLRVSLYFYNTEREIDELVELLGDKDKIIREMI